jgi:hypothetical protein
MNKHRYFKLLRIKNFIKEQALFRGKVNKTIELDYPKRESLS